MRKGLNGNLLKLIALVTMTVDHVGLYLFPYDTMWRIIGRLAMPIFAFMIAEGCRYTRSRSRYFLTVAATALVCQVVYALVLHSLYQCIMVTFSMSIAMICLLDYAQTKKSMLSWLLFALAVAAVYFVCEMLPNMMPKIPGMLSFSVDYGFWGVMLPVLIYTGKDKWQSLFMTLAGLVLLAYGGYWVQWYSLLAVPVLAFYNNERGKWNLKYLFYVYYPLHLVVIYGIDLLLRAA